MKLARVSEDRLRQTFDYWYVDIEHARTISNYLVFGFEPGGFFYSVFANDFIGAMNRVHPLVDVQSLTRVSKWMSNAMPREAYGSYERVERWLKLYPAERRAILENYGLIFTEQEEMWKTLKA